MEHTLSLFGRAPLTAVFAPLFALASPAVFAALPVTNCLDSGVGSLRASVASAASGDTITFPSTLTCSSISLTTGAITIPAAVANLTISTGSRRRMTIEHDNASAPDRVFDHQGTGTFTLNSLNVYSGDPFVTIHGSSTSVEGGCIRSKGSVTLQNAVVSFCSANAGGDASALGGAVFAKKTVSIIYSTLSGNEVGGAFITRGGAIYASSFSAQYSTISNNRSYSSSPESDVASGGGLMFYGLDGGSVEIVGSNISYNSTSGDAGGLSEFIANQTATVAIRNSTISHNHAGHLIGGIFSSASTSIHNSTIAFNTAAQDTNSGPYHHAAGLDVEEEGYSITLDLQSSILSNNTYGTIDDDFSVLELFPSGSVSVTGSNNLIYANFPSTAVPNGTIRFSCPLLGALRDNGGPTQTIALLSHSPAIDTGSNPDLQPFDQRQDPFVRTSGVGLDIGAYEVQQADTVFNVNFEGCPAVL